MTPSELIEAVVEAGGTLELKNDKILYQMPPVATHLLEELRQQREEVKALLQERCISAALPPGVRLISWEPVAPPVVLTRHSLVNDVQKFTETTLDQLRVALEARQHCYLCHCLAGGNRGYSPTPQQTKEHMNHSFRTCNWSIRDVLERLEQVGLKLEVEQQ